MGAFVIEWEGIGPSPSGKAPGFGPDIRRFESCRPSHRNTPTFELGYFYGGIIALEI